MKLVLTEKTQAAALRIPKGKGDGEVEPPLGSTGAAAEDGGDAGDAGARDDDAVASLAVMLSCGERWPERLLRRAGEVGVTGLRPGERSCMR